MQTVSQTFLDALHGSIEPLVRVDAWRGADLLSDPKAGLPVVGGQLTVTAGQAIRSRLTLIVADPDGELLPTSTSAALAPFGTELRLWAGLRLGAEDKLLSMGWFPLMGAEMDLSWSAYTRSDEPTKVYSVQRGGAVNLEAVDRMQVVAEQRFMAAEQPKHGTAFSEIARLVQGVVPFRWPDVPDKPIPAGVTYDDDRLDAVAKLFNVHDMDPIIDVEGNLTGQYRTLGTPVWTVAGGPPDPVTGIGGIQSRVSTKLSRDRAYNGVRFEGTGDDARTVYGTALIEDGPLRWREGFRLPYFASSPLHRYQYQVDDAARTRLANLQQERFLEASVECAWNPALEVGDTIALVGANGEPVPVRITEASWPLTPGPMSLKVTGDPDMLLGAF